MLKVTNIVLLSQHLLIKGMRENIPVPRDATKSAAFMIFLLGLTLLFSCGRINLQGGGMGWVIRHCGQTVR